MQYPVNSVALFSRSTFQATLEQAVYKRITKAYDVRTAALWTVNTKVVSDPVATLINIFSKRSPLVRLNIDTEKSDCLPRNAFRSGVLPTVFSLLSRQY